MIDNIFENAFKAAHTAIFDVGSVMAVLMLVFGILDYRYGDRLRELIEKRRLDKPLIMTGLSLIPVDGTLLFQYNTYRRGSIRFGSLLAGIIGIGEESPYLVLSYNPLAWLMLAGIKLILGVVFGGILNRSAKVARLTEKLHARDSKAGIDENAVQADENFHELPDKFRHRLHHFRYHQLGKAFWIFFAIAFLVEILLNAITRFQWLENDKLQAMGIPFISWLAMLGLFIVVIYRLLIKVTTKEFGKIFEQEFEDTGDAIGDLAETCAGVILLIFLLTFVIESVMTVIGMDRLTALFADRGLLAIAIGALIGLVPGTGASLAFTTLYFTLAGTPGAMPFAALASCSIALIGDSQFIGSQLLRFSQRAAHVLAFVIALGSGAIIWGIERLIS